MQTIKNKTKNLATAHRRAFATCRTVLLCRSSKAKKTGSDLANPTPITTSCPSARADRQPYQRYLPTAPRQIAIKYILPAKSLDTNLVCRQDYRARKPRAWNVPNAEKIHCERRFYGVDGSSQVRSTQAATLIKIVAATMRGASRAGSQTLDACQATDRDIYP